MNTIHAVYENGVFRPTKPVNLPENIEVEFEPRIVEGDGVIDHQDLATSDPGLARIYDILSQKHRSGHSDTAARHNEHQP